MICDLSGENEWWEGERPRETHTERQTERKIYYKTVSWVNHQPFHQSLWEGNESRISTHIQEEQIKLHLLKGVSKNFWPYFKTTVCVCMCGERERERERAEHRKRPNMSDLIYPKCSNYFSVSHLLLHMSKSCIHSSPGNESSVSVIALQSRISELFLAWRSLLTL